MERIPSIRGIQGAGSGFKNGFDDVMGIFSLQDFDMEIHADVGTEGIKKFMHHFCIKTAHGGHTKIIVKDQKGSAGKVHSRQYKGLIHRKNHTAEAADPFFCAYCLAERLSEHNSCIFDGMMAVHFQIAAGRHLQIKKTVAGKTVQHVVEKTDSRMNICLAAAVQIDGDRNICFSCFSADRRCTLIHKSSFLLLFLKTDTDGIGMGCQVF